MKKLAVVLAAGVACSSVAAFSSTPDLPSCNVWKAAASCNYTVSNRPSSYSIDYVIIHKAQGTAAGTASWFQNCSAAASAHYAIDNNTGYCYQMVYEKDIAWHAGNWNTNCHSIGIEHGGYVANNDTKTACYDKSAVETKSCIVYYSVAWDRSHILGHSQVPGATHTDPGAYWNWSYYMTKCNPANTAASMAAAPTYICDNTNAGFTASANWSTSSSSADKYGTNYRFRPTASISDAAQWVFNLPTAGVYEIHAWWPAGTNRSSNIPYIMPNASSVYVNQKTNGGKWNLLGAQSLVAGSNMVRLSCWTTSGSVAVADAVKFTFVK